MVNIAPERLTDLDFWESNAPWYALWLRHNNYHGPIKNIFAARLRWEWWTQMEETVEDKKRWE